MTNREDIISMAREAWRAAGEGWVIEQWFHDRESALTRFADLVAASAKAEEREACAKIFELYWNDAGLQRTYSPTKYINTVKEWNDYKEKNT